MLILLKKISNLSILRTRQKRAKLYPKTEKTWDIKKYLKIAKTIEKVDETKWWFLNLSSHMTQSVCVGGEKGDFGKARGLQISTNKEIISIDPSCT